MDILVVTAVEAERAAICASLPPGSSVRVVAAGVGPAAAAAGTAAELARSGADVVLNAGIGGGFTGCAPGDLAVASSIVFADLGAESAQGFVPMSELGFGADRYQPAPKLAVELADRTGGRLGTIVTVATATGSAQRADALSRRFPDVVAEGMEGAGVAAAAERFGVAVAEIRAVSNAVGPRDREAWRIPEALAALGRAVAAAVSETPSGAVR
ncbi:MAG TPA: futalosine hydrolase [Jatrophihabitans sp.]|nr:futalosine hydrolase [Jatrophihabitans sp.]